MAKTKVRPDARHPNDAKWDSVIADMHRLADTFREGGMPAVEKAFKVTRLPGLVAPAAQSAPSTALTGVSPIRGNLDRLRAEVAAFANQREQAEAKSAEVDPVVRQIGLARMADPGLQVIGQVVDCSSDEGDLNTYSLAAIQVPDGVGVERYTLGFRELPGEDTPRWFVPFAECEPSVQARLAPHIDGLLGELLRRLNIPAAVVG